MKIRSIILMLLLTVVAGCSQSEPLTLRVLTYNIHHGAGMDGRIDLERIAGIIRESGADIVALQEVDNGVRRSGKVDQPQKLGELAGMQAVFGGNFDLQGGSYGNAVLTKLPVTSQTNHRLPRLGDNEQRGLLETHLRKGEREIVFLATHIDHQKDDTERLASANVIEKLIEDKPEGIVFLAGDFNATPETTTIKKFKTFLIVCESRSDDPLLSYPADVPARRIDYIMYRENDALNCIDLRVLDYDVASDHRPVLATFGR